VKKVKIMGLGVVMALTLSALIGVGSAAGSGFTATSLPAYVSGSINGAHGLAGTGWETKCTGLGFKATAGYPAETLTTTSIEDGSCFPSSGSTLKTNGCQFTFRPGAETSPGNFKGTYDIGPAGCVPITLTIPFKPMSCEVTIGAQTGLPATFINYISSVGIAISGPLKYTEKRLGTSSTCTNGTFTNGQWQGEWIVSGEGIQVASKILTLIAIEGSPASLVADKFPAALSGTQAGAHDFGTSYGKISCNGAQFSGEASAITANFALGTAYSDCRTLGIPGTTINMNGCQYLIHVTNTGAPYGGTADVQCPAGKSIEILTKIVGTLKCTTTIAAQSGLSGLTFENYSGAYVSVGMNLSGLKYHQEKGAGAGPCSTGDFTNGTYAGSFTMTGSA
jgi:hypothetical protein